MPTFALPTDALADFCRRHGLRSLALFGSFLHGDADDDSDVDLLFDLLPGRRVGLFDLHGGRHRGISGGRDGSATSGQRSVQV